MAGQKAKYWVAVGYQENLDPDWKEVIGDVVQVPYVYCEHKADLDGKEEERKDHVHIILAFPNTTTYNHALNVFKMLNRSDKNAFPTCKQIINIRHMYDYLIHDTDDCRKKGKHLYDKTERIEGNGFDIGLFEQLSLEDKKIIRSELSRLIFEKEFINYFEFYIYVLENYDSNYEDVICAYSGHFERLTRGQYLKKNQEALERRKIIEEFASAEYAAYLKAKRESEKK